MNLFKFGPECFPSYTEDNEDLDQP